MLVEGFAVKLATEGAKVRETPMVRHSASRCLAVAAVAAAAAIVALLGELSQLSAQVPKGIQIPALQRGRVPRVPLPARKPGESKGDEEELATDGVFLPPDRAAKRRLELADEMLEQRRYGESVRLLGSILENAEDFFFKPEADQPVYRSLKAEAGRLIAGLPGEGRDSYELQFGARARTMLERAIAEGNFEDVAEVARQFYYSQAGQEATFLLGRHHLDQNRPLGAALCLEQLRSIGSAKRLEPVLSLTLATAWLRAGRSDKAQETLVRLKASHPGELLVGGKAIKLFANDAQALAWMDEKFGPQRAVHTAASESWTMFRGDESRSASSQGGQPLLAARWRQRTGDDGVIEKLVSKVRHDYANQDVVALPSMHPLAVGDTIIMRTAFALEAVDFRTGKLVWKYPAADDALEQFLRAGTQPSGAPSQPLLSGLEQRMWEDATYGTLSSDGVRVYSVEDLGLAGSNSSVLMTVMPNGQRHFSVNSRSTNRLAARELNTQGKLAWEIGGVAGGDEPELAGVFFLGPPLPLMGRLYALVERSGPEIRLVALNARTGELEWSQQLAVAEKPITEDAFRRNAGATPSFADGVLICPTAAGAIVAIDLTTRSLLWGYQYPRAAGAERPVGAVRPTAYPGNDRRGGDRWSDGCVTISGGRVLLSPVETDQLFCLNLADGKELWKKPRGEQLYVAGVHRGNVILVGSHAVSALQLADGEKAWDDLDLPAGSAPSGRGFQSGDHYYLPLSIAEVAKIDLQAGRIERRARSRTGQVPGNLISYRGSIISQGTDYVDAFYQLDTLKEQIAKTLEAHPDDPKAQAALGEVKLDQGLLAEAVVLFRRSYELKNDEATREQLVESMLEALRVDFAANRGSLDELEGLIREPKHRLSFLRSKALGLHAAGELAPAFQTYLKIVDLDAPRSVDKVDDELSVRRDHWLRSQLERLSAAAGDLRGEIDTEISTRQQAALANSSVDAVRVFATTFGFHPSAAAARDALVARLSNDELLERNLLLREGERSSDPAIAGQTTAALAKLLADAGREDLAAIYYRELANRFAEVPCRDGKTGAQLAADLPVDSPLRKLLTNAATWPRGSVKSQEDKAPARSGAPAPRMPRASELEVVGPVGPLLKNVSISYDVQQFLLAQDALGERRFRIQLSDQNTKRVPMVYRSNYNTPVLSYVSTNGGLIVLSLGSQIMAIDTLRGDDSAASRVLWAHDLNDHVGPMANSQGVMARGQNLPWGGLRYVPEDSSGRRIGSIGPVNDDGVFYQRLHDLHCVDPLTGKTTWLRKNVGLGNDLFGDSELLFVAPAGEGETLVLKAKTGEVLGTRRIAPFNRRMATLGRRVLSWESQNGANVLQLRDAWTEQTVWSHTFPGGAKAAIIAQEAVGVFQPSGEFSLITLADGKMLVNEKLEPESSLAGIYLMKWREGYLLVTNSANRTENIMAQPVPNGPTSALVNGRLYAFEAGTGKKMWPSPLVLSQQGLLLSQPSDLPVLCFVRQVYKPSGPTRAGDPKVSVMCVDKRTGRIVYETDQLPGTTIVNYEVTGDPQNHTVTLTLASKQIKLTFSDEAEAPAPEAPAAPAAKEGKESAMHEGRQRASEKLSRANARVEALIVDLGS